MNERVLKTLEFHRLAEMVCDQAETSIGKDLASKIRPNSSLEEVEELQAQTDEAVQIFRLNKVIPLGGISDIRPSVKRSAIGSILAADEVLRIGDTLYGGRQAKAFWSRWRI